MKTKSQTYLVMLSCMLLSVILSCQKDNNNDESPNTNTGNVQDVDGNTYNTLKIGEQWWMAENLKTTKFSTGEDIPYIASDGEWTTAAAAAYCNSDNDTANAMLYGGLYNWYAVSDNRKICPEGWHTPSDDDWTELINFLGGNDVAGGKLKQTGTAYWNSPNGDASNESGFSALPGGTRNGITGNFAGIGSTENWWSTTQHNNDAAYAWGLTSVNGSMIHYNLDKNAGLAVRCIKD